MDPVLICVNFGLPFPIPLLSTMPACSSKPFNMGMEDWLMCGCVIKGSVKPSATQFFL